MSRIHFIFTYEAPDIIQGLNFSVINLTRFRRDRLNMSDTLTQTIEKFIEKEYCSKKKSKTAATNLLIGQAKEVQPEQKDNFVFLHKEIICNLKDRPITDKEVINNIPAAIKESVASYVKDHNTAIDIYKRYITFVKKNYFVILDVDFPPTFNSRFDRQMYIVKSIHQRKYQAAEIAGELWFNERTISGDLQELEDGITILGQKLKIYKQDLIYRNTGLNTVHPIFLAANLTQIVVLLRGLEQQGQDPAYHEYAVRLAANIWSELSDYGRNRIMTVSEQLNLNITWFDMLEEKRNKGLYSTEANCSYNKGAGSVLDFLKNGKRCAIEINGLSGIEIIENCFIKAYLPSPANQLTVLHQGKELIIPINSVIGASEYGKCMY